MNILLASGVVVDPSNSPVRDVGPEGGAAYKPYGYTHYRLNLPDPEELKTSHGTMAAAHLGLTSAGLIRPPTGIGAGPAIALGALWLLSSGDKDPREVSGDHPLDRPLLIAWEKEPDRWFNHWTRAVLESLKQIDPAFGYQVTIVPELDVRRRRPAWLAFLMGDRWQRATLRSAPEFGIARITGGRCDQVLCLYYPDKLVRTLYLAFSCKWPLDRAPDFLGGFTPAVLILDNLAADFLEPTIWIDDSTQIEDPDFPFFWLFEAISARLPESYFIYLPPGISLGPGRGKTDFPVVLNQGKRLLFEKPNVGGER